MDFFFFGLTFLLMSVVSPTVLSLGVLILSFMLGLSLTFYFSSWFSYVLFLLYIGGMMVIIMYFSTLIPNQSFMVGKSAMVLLVGCSIVLGLLMMKGGVFVEGSGVDSLMLYEGGNMYLALGLLLFLFVLMVLVVVVTSFFGAPLRPMK